jgi:hypothetical protein
MFNTHMQQASFHATALQEQADSLTARKQALDMELESLRDPQRLAERAKRLGMVAPSVPAFIRLSDGRIVGSPLPATPEDAVRVHGVPAVKPLSLDPEPLVITVHPREQQRSGATGSASATGTNGDTASAATSSEGATR